MELKEAERFVKFICVQVLGIDEKPMYLLNGVSWLVRQQYIQVVGMFVLVKIASLLVKICLKSYFTYNDSSKPHNQPQSILFTLIKRLH
jgi:hypothetical protein